MCYSSPTPIKTGNKKMVSKVENCSDVGGLAIQYLNGKTEFLLDSCEKSLTYSFAFVNGVLESIILDNDYKLIVNNS